MAPCVLRSQPAKLLQSAAGLKKRKKPCRGNSLRSLNCQAPSCSLNRGAHVNRRSRSQRFSREVGIRIGTFTRCRATPAAAARNSGLSHNSVSFPEQGIYIAARGWAVAGRHATSSWQLLKRRHRDPSILKSHHFEMASSLALAVTSKGHRTPENHEKTSQSARLQEAFAE